MPRTIGGTNGLKISSTMMPMTSVDAPSPTAIGQAVAFEPDGSLEFDLDDLDTPAYMRQGRLLN